MKKILLSLTLLVSAFANTNAQIGPCSGTPMPVIAAQYMPACAGHNDTVYANAFLNKGLVAYYPFNGNANDLSGNGYNATTVGVSLATDRFGNANKCYNFAGTSTYIQCPSAAYFTGGSFTISGWVNVTNVEAWGRLIDFGNGAGSDNVLVALNGGGSYQLLSSTGPNFQSSQILDNNTWVQVLFTYNVNTGYSTCYYNGVAIDSGTVSQPNNVVRNQAYIGLSNWGGDGGVFGSMDDIRIYDRNLSSTEVSQLYSYESTGESQTTYTWSGGSNSPYIVSNSGTPTTVTYTLTQTRNGAVCSAADTFRLATINCTAALDYDGADDYVTIPNTAPLNNQFSGNQITVEGWFYTRSVAPGTVPTLIGEAYMGDGNVAFSMYMDDSGKLYAGFFDGTWEEATTTYTLNTWQHIACTYDQQNIKLYINGVLAATTPMTNPLPVGTEEWRIGRRWDFLETHNGQMDEIAIWNVVRTPTQIQSDMGCLHGGTGTPAGLVAFYNFDDGIANKNNASINTLTDKTGNGNDGTLNNFALTGTTSNWVTDAGMLSAVPSITSVVASNTLVCSGATTTLTVNGTASTYTWSANAASATAATVNVHPVNNATYTVIGANNLCKVMDSVSVNVNALPTVFVTTHTLVCVGTKDTLTAGGAVTYTWTPGNIHLTMISGIINAPVTFTLAGTDANGCKNSVVETISVNALPTLSVSVTNSVICAGNATTLTGQGATTYTWTGGVINNTPFTPGSTLTYTVTGTDANGCKNKTSQMVTVNQLPIISASATNSVICMGASTTLMGAGATTYTWTGGVIDNTPFSPAGTNSYSVTGTDANGCVSSNTAVQSVAVNPLPNVTASATNTVICAGGTTTLMGGGANTYTWTGGVTDNTAFNPAGTGVDTYTVSGTENVNGCTNKAVISVTVNALPTVTANSATICTGNTATLTVSGTATSFTWSTTDNTTSIMESPTTPTDYTVNATDANGCVNMAVASVAVNALPTVTVNSATICTGNTATLTVSGTATSFTWSTTDNTTSVMESPTTPTDYTVNGTDANGCVNMAVASVAVNALPTISVNSNTVSLCSGSSATLTASGASTFTWSTSDIGATTIVTPTITATYTVTGTDANGCDNMTTFTQTVSTTCSGIEQYGNSINVSVYPNPSNGTFVVSTVEHAKTIVVMDILGNELLTVTPTDTKTTINLNAQANGIYFVKVIANNTQTIKRIVINN